MDITIREKIVFPIASVSVLKAYDEYEDLPADARIGVYSIKEIVAEKIVAPFSTRRETSRVTFTIYGT